MARFGSDCIAIELNFGWGNQIFGKNLKREEIINDGFVLVVANGTEKDKDGGIGLISSSI